MIDLTLTLEELTNIRKGLLKELTQIPVDQEKRYESVSNLYDKIEALETKLLEEKYEDDEEEF
jgi:hypothetical protein